MKVDACFVIGFNHIATNLPIACIGVFIVAMTGRNGTGILFLCILVMQ